MSEPHSAPVTYELVEGVAVLRIDDGKANVITHELADRFERALSHALADDAGAVAIIGRPGRFSAGFDLATMKAGPEEARDLLRVGAELALRIYRFPVPVLMGVTGHALAMGAILLLSGDVRIAARGDFKIGLNEVAIGMPVPKFVTELADDRLDRRHLTESVSLATIYDPDSAIAAGYIDEVLDPDAVGPATIERAAQYASTLSRGGFALTRTNLRGERANRIEAGLAADIAQFEVGIS